MMTQTAIVAQMQGIAQTMKRGRISIEEAEKAMSETISDNVKKLPGDTFEQVYAKDALRRKLHRRMWRILLDATK